MSLPIIEDELQTQASNVQAIGKFMKEIDSKALNLRKDKIDDDRYDHFMTDDINEIPEGYPQLTTFITSDINTKLFRRFTYLRTRLLLHHQTTLTKLESQLAALDKLDGAHPDNHMLLHSTTLDRRDDGNPTRIALLSDIQTLLREYDEMLLRENSIGQIRSASRRVHRNFFDWVWNEQPLVKQDLGFVFHRDDFLALGMGEESWFLGFMDRIRWVIPGRLEKVIFSHGKDEAQNTSMENVDGYSNVKLALFAKVLLALLSTVFLMLPCIILYLVSMSKGVQVTISCLAVLLFALAIALFTKARLHEVFVATAAYSAVLVVFLGTQQASV